MLGVYTIALSIYFVFTSALGSGMTATVSRFTAENKVSNSKQKSHKTVSSGLIINIVICLVLLIVLFSSKSIFLKSFDGPIVYYLLISMAPSILFTAIYAPFRGYMWGEESYFKVSLVEFVEQIIRIGSCFILFLFLSKTDSIFATGISISIACAISTMLGIVFFLTSKGKLKSPKGEIKPLLKTSGTLTMVRMASSLMQPFLAFLLPARLIVAGFSKSQALSALGITMGMTFPLLSIPTTIIGALGTALIPKISGLLKEKDTVQLKKQISSSIIFTLCCCFIVVPIFYSLGVDIAIFIFDNQLAGEFLKKASWLIVPMGLSQLTTSILNSLGHETKTFIYYLISSVFLLLAIYFLPAYFGIYSLLFGMGMSSIVVSALNIIKINKTINLKNYFVKDIAILIAITIPMSILGILTKQLLSLVFPPFVTIALVCLLLAGFFILFLVVWGKININLIPFKIKNIKIKRKKERKKNLA